MTSTTKHGEPAPIASIIIRAFNEQKHIGRLLRGIAAQQPTVAHEVIVVDSGSTDRTAEIAQEHGASLVHIRPEDFSFGRALNLGIEASRREFCVLISAHCYPEDEAWLSRLLAPFADPKVALVYGRQRGEADCRFSEQQIFKRWFPDGPAGVQGSGFCNNANAAIRRALWRDLPYDESLTGLEDLDWARRAQRRGHSIYYEPKARVIHVHNEKWAQVLHRYEREAMALRRIDPQARFGLSDLVSLSVLNISADYLRALRHGALPGQLFSIPAMRLMQFLGTYRGYQHRGEVSDSLRKIFYYPAMPAFVARRARKPEPAKAEPDRG